MTAIDSITEVTRRWAEQRSIPLVYNEETGSTNEDAKAMANRESLPFVLYLSAHQTQGKGRGTNEWLDTGSGECLLSTWSYSVEKPPQPITVPRIGLALYHAARTVWPALAWSLKAPNDLFLSGKKVGGLLIESITHGSSHRLLIGLGLNVLNHPRKFKEATHLLSEEHAPTLTEGEWFSFLDQLRDELASALPECQVSELSEEARQDLMQALNANPTRTYVVNQVTPQGDLVHDRGTIRWTEL